MIWKFLSLLISVDASKCRVLSMSGGGSYGSYEAGAFMGLVRSLPAEEVEYNVVVGISAGSWNGFCLSQWPMGAEEKAADYMFDFWNDMDGSSSVFKEWLGGYAEGLLYKSGLVDTAPLRELLKSQIIELRRNITMGGTNLNTGHFQTFNESLGDEVLVETGMVSSAVPMLFETQHFMGDEWVDGGCIYNNDYYSAITRCLDVTGGVEEDIIIDILGCFSHSLSENQSDMNSIDVLLREHTIKSYDSNAKYIYWAKRAYPNVQFRYIILPSEPLPGTTPFDFNHTALMGGIEIGIKDAENAVKNGIFAEDVLRKHHKNEERVFAF